ncbi:MAG: small-conductance mechanosensitive ion channel [Gemmatimonadota bacterium]|nr:small-conductance mechanosensitive ion channel [Gemmatimonadota bacterium]
MQAPIPVAVQSLGDSIRLSLTNAFAMFFGAIPRVIAFLVILLIGWFIASLLAKAVAALLRAVNFNDLARRSGISDFVEKMGVQTDPSGLLADVVKWFVRLIALVAAFDALGLAAISDVLRQFLLWIPNLFVALVVLVIGGLLARAVARMVRGAAAEAGFTNPDTLAAVASVAVWAFAIIVAVNQVGIATALINTLFIGVVGALALAIGLSFGLGGREKAASLIEQWSNKTDEAVPRAKRTGEAAKH